MDIDQRHERIEKLIEVIGDNLPFAKHPEQAHFNRAVLHLVSGALHDLANIAEYLRPQPMEIKMPWDKPDLGEDEVNRAFHNVVHEIETPEQERDRNEEVIRAYFERAGIPYYADVISKAIDSMPAPKAGEVWPNMAIVAADALREAYAKPLVKPIEQFEGAVTVADPLPSGHAQKLADELSKLCDARTEGKFFDKVTDNIQTIILALNAYQPLPKLTGETIPLNWPTKAELDSRGIEIVNESGSWYIRTKREPGDGSLMAKPREGTKPFASPVSDKSDRVARPTSYIGSGYLPPSSAPGGGGIIGTVEAGNKDREYETLPDVTEFTPQPEDSYAPNELLGPTGEEGPGPHPEGTEYVTDFPPKHEEGPQADPDPCKFCGKAYNDFTRPACPVCPT